jgi:endonuclease/exonuclease/phosphatase (EEP) superfamily protein YafD
VLLSKPSPWTVVNSEVLDEPIASDHRPVVVELEWVGKE